MVEQLKDIDARWTLLQQIRESVAFAKDKDPAMTPIINAPNADIYVIDVSFKALKTSPRGTSLINCTLPSTCR
jgi:NTE family protein